MSTKLSFGQWVKQRRKALDLTQHALAQRIGCALATIQKIEIDARQPSQQMAELLAEHLEVAAAERDAFLRLARRRPTNAQPLLTLAPPLGKPINNLPTPLTSLVGREWEVTTLCARLLQAEVRLLTITGPPGIGKTRLALSVAQAIANWGSAGESGATNPKSKIQNPKFADGVCFVPLAAISEARFVTAAIARALAVKDTGGQPLLERLKGYLRERQLLLVLDNFEHLLPAAPLVAELLEVAPALKVLTTSRALLQVYGEHQFVTPPLALPNLKQLPTHHELAGYPSVELFVQRARAVRLDFVLSAENAPVVAELCVRLDGLPLAIELAAARSKLFTPATLLARLTHPADGADAPLGVLTGDARNLPPRQQTLRNSIAWSYNLLNPIEQSVFRALGVFAGGCTLEALQAVVSDQRAGGKLRATQAEGWLLNVVHALINQSLVVHVTSADEAPRFTLLEMMREFALEQLTACGELAAMQRAHATYFLRLAELFGGHPQQRQATLSPRTFEPEFDNLRSAMDWLALHEPALGLRLTAYISDFWRDHGLHSEARHRLEGVLAQAAPEISYPYALALGKLGMIVWMQGDHAVAQVHLESSIVWWRTLGEQSELGIYLQFLAVVLYNLGEYEAGLASAQESVAIMRAQGEPVGLAIALNALGRLYSVIGASATARTVQEECLALFRQQNDPWGVALALGGLGDSAASAGDPSTARRYFEEALPLYRQAGDHWHIAQVLWYLGGVSWQQDNQGQAITLWEESVAVGREVGVKDFVGGSLLRLGFAAQQTGDRQQAQLYFTESLAVFRQMAHNAGIAYALSGLAALFKEPPQSAQLLGAVSVLLTSRPMLGAALEQSHYQRISAEVRAQLDEATFAAAWATGQAMTLAEAVTFAGG